MSLGILILGLAVFLVTHVFVSFRQARASVIERVGLPLYRGLFAIVSLAGLALIIWGYAQYRAHGLIQLWSPPAFMRHVTIGLVLFAAIFIVAAFFPSHIRSKLKHPMLASVKTWALAHLVSNGDLGSILLFGSFLLWGGFHRITLKYRSDPGAPPIPAGDRRRDWIAIAVGTLLYLALGFIFHPLVVGIPVFGRPAY